MIEQWEVGGGVMTEAECVSIVLNLVRLLLHNKGIPYPARLLAYIYALYMLPSDGIRHPCTSTISFKLRWIRWIISIL